MAGRLLVSLIAGAGVGLCAVSSPAAAALGTSALDARTGGGLSRLAVSRGGGAAGAGTGALQLAAKKKKKKKRKTKVGDTSDTTPGEQDSGGDAAPAGGASDADVQRAARVAPTADSDAGGVSARPKRGAPVVIEGEAGPSRGSGELPARYLDLEVGGQAFARSLTYNQLVQGALREYQPGALGGLAAGIVYYPLVHFMRGFITNLGLEVNIDQTFGLSSKTPDGTTFNTQAHDYNGNLRLRIRLDGLEPSLTVGYGDQAYKLTGTARAALLLPDTEYKYVRAAAGVRAALPGRFALFATAGYRQVLSAGSIKDDYFHHLKVAGVEASAYLGYALTDLIEARVGVDFRRYFFAMHSVNGDMYLAGGAIDQTIAGTASLAVTLGGPERTRTASAAEEAPAAAPAGEGDPDAPVARKRARRPKPDDGETPATE